ncbi:unnamed protein product [Arabidopsis thaliana]|uniref:Uncharacterized protein n=1 Tax=Arabidopsis thaliana TaxID=3702 RepID=A0A654EZJ9_ARATH|nr:unnamed protein product [Arabidopsis thaliana]
MIESCNFQKKREYGDEEKEIMVFECGGKSRGLEEVKTCSQGEEYPELLDHTMVWTASTLWSPQAEDVELIYSAVVRGTSDASGGEAYEKHSIDCARIRREEEA